MEDALLIHRLHFAFTASFHYLFPQLTMGLGLLIVILKWLAIRKKNQFYSNAAKFWAKIFAINFAVGVVTGIPMEFQFGTNWARFSAFAGGVIGQTLAMEGMFAFFLESTFLGLFLYGEKKLGEKGHFLAAVAVWLGSWISGYFIVATNAWMQHPVAYTLGSDGMVHLNDYWGLLLNPWVGWQYVHTMGGSVITAAFVMTSVGAYYLLKKRNIDYGKLFIRIGVITGIIASFSEIFPSGDLQSKNILAHQPPTLAAMEGVFKTKKGAELILWGTPNMESLKVDNAIAIPKLLSFLSYRDWNAEVKGLDSIPPEQWPTNIPLLFHTYHIMIGLGMFFVAIMALAAFLLWRKTLFEKRWVLWILLLSFPLPYIANTAGWATAELGRQPWVVYQLMHIADGTSSLVTAGSGMFSLLGFAGIYLILGLLFVILVVKKIKVGPAEIK